MSGQIPVVNPAVLIQPITTGQTQLDSSQVPNPFANVPAGTLIEGFVVNRNAQQQPVLRTSIGDVLVHSEIFLKTGSEVVIRVEPNISGHARILTIDGLEPQNYAQQLAARTVTTDTILPSSITDAAQNAETKTANPQPVLQAVLLKALPNPAAPLPNAAPSTGAPAAPLAEFILPDGKPAPLATTASLQPALQQISPAGNFKIQLLATQLPAPVANIAASVANPAPGTAATTPGIAAPTSAPPTAAQPSITFTGPLAGNQVAQAAPNVPQTLPSSYRPLTSNTPPITSTPTGFIADVEATPGNTPPATSATTTAGTLPAPSTPSINPQIARTQWYLPPAQLNNAALQQAVPSVVIGHEQDGASVVQTPIGQFKLFTPQPLPTGTHVLFTIDAQPLARPNVPTSLLPPRLQEAAPLLRDWDTLADAVAQVAQAQPSVAADVLQHAIAHPGNKLTSGMLFFLSALQGGDLRQLLGKNFSDTLEKISPETLKKLGAEFAQMQQLARDPITPNWSLFLIPIQHEREFNQVQLFLRHEEDSEKRNKQSGGGQRFVLDVHFSHLGDMQLDGFTRKANNQQMFDLVVRSAKTFPVELQQQIRSIYEDALASTGMRGMLQWQVGSQHFVRPLHSGATEDNGASGGLGGFLA